MAARYPCKLWYAVCCLLAPSFDVSTAAAMAGPKTSNVPQKQQSIKLMTYNIHAWRDSNHQCNFDRVTEVVNAVHPDILCLNEVLHPFARPSVSSSQQKQILVEDYYRQVESNKGRDNLVDPSFTPEEEKLTFLYRLAEATNLNNVEFTGATDNSYFGKGVSFGNAILTRYPIVDCLHVPLTVDEGDMELGKQKRDFVDPRAFSAAILQLDDNYHHCCCIAIVFAHLDHKSEELREKQIKQGISESQEFLKDTPQLVCGDFNSFQKSDSDSTGWQKILDLYDSRGWPTPLERSLVLDALVDGFGYQDTFYESLKRGSLSDKRASRPQALPDPTSWTNDPLMRIDHVLVKNQPGSEPTTIRIVPTRHYRIDTDASDHFPVVVEANVES